MRLITFKKIIDKIKKTLINKTPDTIRNTFEDLIYGENYLSQIEFHIVDNCNLNCAYCDHFTPLSPEKIYKIDDIILNLKKLKNIFKKIGKIYILGGEPLLHKNLTDIFKPLRDLYQNSEIIVVTNGVLLEKQNDNFWNSMKKYNITLSMTHYPININYDKYLDKCKNMGIKAYYFNLDRNKMKNINLDKNGKRNSKKAYKLCTRKHCHFLKDNKLYVCTVPPNIEFLNNHFGLNFEVNENDYIDLDKITNPKEIKRKLRKPINFCKYCEDKKNKYCEYKISEKKLEEWVEKK